MIEDKFKVGYLAPLNYDRFFKQVFSDIKIAKCFLEDFLDTEIQTIKPLKKVNKLTKVSKSVKFDFRCKTDDKHIIIEMQQWEKQDIVQRFLTYLAVNISLQLEDLPDKSIKRGEEIIEIKDYRRLEPSIILIWLVDDDFKQNENFISYSPYPESIAKFIRDTKLWNSNCLQDLIDKRNDLLTLLNNKHRSLDFLQENKLIFMFQPNIICSEKITKYKKWFEFAEKTRDFTNIASDFDKYKNEPIFVEMMRMLLTKSFDKEQFDYLKKTKKINEGLKSYEEGVYEYGFIDGEVQGIEKGIEKEKANSKKIIEQAKAEKQQAELKAEVFKLLLQGKNVKEISQILEISTDYIQEILPVE